jgi:hypothetical protein
MAAWTPPPTVSVLSDDKIREAAEMTGPPARTQRPARTPTIPTQRCRTMLQATGKRVTTGPRSRAARVATALPRGTQRRRVATPAPACRAPPSAAPVRMEGSVAPARVTRRATRALRPSRPVRRRRRRARQIPIAAAARACPIRADRRSACRSARRALCRATLAAPVTATAPPASRSLPTPHARPRATRAPPAPSAARACAPAASAPSVRRIASSRATSATTRTTVAAVSAPHRTASPSRPPTQGCARSRRAAGSTARASTAACVRAEVAGAAAAASARPMAPRASTFASRLGDAASKATCAARTPTVAEPWVPGSSATVRWCARTRSAAAPWACA